MRGSIYRRGKTWTAVYDEHPDEHGKRRQRSKGGFATKREANAFLTEQLARLERGTYVAPSKLTLAEYLTAEWLPAVRGTLRPLSVTKYQQVIRRLHVVPRIGSTRLQALSAGTLNGLYADLEDAGLSAATRRLVHAILGRALRDAERWGRVTRNVARMADPPSRATSRATSWTAGELRRFLDHVEGNRLYALWRLAATTGMRRGELAAVTWRALDLDDAKLSVEQQVLRDRSFGPPKSSRSRRTVALDPLTVEALREHRATPAPRARLRGRGIRGWRPGLLRRARRADLPAAPDGLVQRTPEGRGHPERIAARPAAHGSDVGADARRAGSHRRGEARGRPQDDSGDVRPPAPAVRRSGGGGGRGALVSAS